MKSTYQWREPKALFKMACIEIDDEACEILFEHCMVKKTFFTLFPIPELRVQFSQIVKVSTYSDPMGHRYLGVETSKAKGEFIEARFENFDRLVSKFRKIMSISKATGEG